MFFSFFMYFSMVFEAEIFCHCVLQIYPNGTWKNTLLATGLCSVVVTLCMTPFDVVSVRLYNQKVNAHGQGTLYSGFIDCVQKILRKEGPLGFYKGTAAVFFRLAPHTVLNLLFWDELRKFYFGFVRANLGAST